MLRAPMTTVLRIDPKAKRPKRRILVVDDDLDTVHSMALLFRGNGHEVQFAINGFAALDIARKFRPDIVILDIGLPDFDGTDIARQLRWEPGMEKLRMIALTGRNDDENRQRALEAGCEMYLVKPASPQILESLIDRPDTASRTA
jgi:CheY-like chemotaxis protein